MAQELNTDPGIYEGIPDAVYHRSQLCSNSTLGEIDPQDGKCPANLWYKRQQPEEPLATPHTLAQAATDIGTATHTAMLQPELLDDHVVLLPDVKSYNSKAAREQWEEIRDANPDKVYLRPAVWDKVRALRDAVYESPYHARTREFLALAGPRELTVVQPMEGNDSEVLCKARIDQAVPSADLLIDWKTARDASPKGFGKAVVNNRYYRQAAFYTGIVDASGLFKPRGFVFVVIETEPPYLPGYYEMTLDAIIEGRAEYRRLLDIYGRCERSDDWPGYVSDGEIPQIELPRWFKGA